VSVRGGRAAAAAFLAGAALVYGVGLFNAFQYDDYHMVVYNPAIRDSAMIPRMVVDKGVFSGTEQVQHYRPLILASYTADFAMSGSEPWAYHGTNILIHGVTAWLVFLLAGAWGLPGIGSLIAGLVFLIAPAHSEAVNYVAARSSLLATVFSVAAVYGYSRFRQCPGAPWRAGAWLAAAYLSWGLGLLSKEIAIVVPALMMAYDVVVAPRTRWGRFGFIAPYLPLVAGALYYLREGRVASIAASIVTGGGNRDPLMNLWTQLRVAVRALWLYLWPAGLSVHHEVVMSASWLEWPVIASAAVLTALTAAAIWAARRARSSDSTWAAPALGWSWFVIASLPTSLIPLHMQFQEHRLYFPGVGVALVFGWLGGRAVAWLAAAGSVRRWATAAAVGGGLVIGMTTVDFHRTRLWGDELALWKAAEAREAPSAHILNGVGVGHLRRGDAAAALDRFAAAMHLDPSYHEAFANAAYALHRLGRHDEALALYESLIREHPTQATYVLMAGGLYHLKGDLARAERAYRETIRLTPRFADAYEGLGGVLFQRHAYPEAVEAFERAERLGLTHAALRVKLAYAYRAIGRSGSALAVAEAAFRDSPNAPGLAELLEALRAERGGAEGSAGSEAGNAP
jgi:tetratricopeptide (TPR) repeat protein